MDEALVVGATVTRGQCPRCRQMLPVECGDITGLPIATIDDLIRAVEDEMERTCPHAAGAVISIGGPRA